MKTTAPREMGQRADAMARSRARPKITKSTPCAQPRTLTKMGMPAKYFSGIAMPSKRRKDQPSSKQVRRRKETEFIVEAMRT